MIKKLLWLCIFWLSLLLWYTNAYWLQVLYNWIEWEIHSYPLSTYWNTFTLWNNANFLLNWQYKIFSQIDRETDLWNSVQYARLRNVFWTENWIYVILTTWTKNSVSTIQTNNIKQWYIHQYCKTTYWTTENEICSTYTNYNWTYNVYDISTFYENSQYNNPDIILYNWKWQYFNFCFWYESLNENICFNLESTDCNDYCNTSCTSANSIPQMANNKQCNSLWLTYNPLMSEFWTNTDTITPIATNSLFLSSSGDWIVIWSGWIALNTTWSAINYFEKNYWRNENICYVWIDNVTDLWWSSVSFEYWTGLSIFETFNTLYWNIDLDKVYVWLNSWIINYSEWFWRGWNPLYLASYNSWTNQVDLRYDNLTFPFSWNPVAVYFMTNNIDNFWNPSWSEIVSYCNLKINDWTFDEIIDQAVKNNITKYTEQSNKNNWLNPDWTNKNYFWSWFIFTWNIWEYTWVTWDQLQYSGDVNLKSFFDNALEEMKGALDNFQNPLTWMLPSYIIYAFLFVALFKLLRK